MHLELKSMVLHWSVNEQFGFKSKVLHGFLTAWWVSAPATHNKVYNVNFDIGGGGGGGGLYSNLL